MLITLATPVLESVTAGAPLTAPARRSANDARFRLDARWKRSPERPSRVGEVLRRRRFASGCTTDLIVRATTAYDVTSATDASPSPTAAVLLRRQVPAPTSSGAMRNTGVAAGGVTSAGAWATLAVTPMAINGFAIYRLDATRPVGDGAALRAVSYPQVIVNALSLGDGCARYRATVTATVRDAVRGLRVVRARPDPVRR